MKIYLSPINKDLVAVGVIIFLTMIAYFPVLNNQFTNWDDNVFVTSNELIRSFSLSNIKQWFTQPFEGQYQPFVLLSFAFDYQIDGYNPKVFHITNLILHLINSVLVFYFIELLFTRRFIALFAALLFALHPVNVESVAWVTERKNVLFCMFFFISLLLYIKYQKNKDRSLYYCSLLFFLIALLSKSAAVTLPLILLLIDAINKRELISRKQLTEKTPYFLMALIVGILTILAHHDFGALTNNHSIPARILVSGSSILLYFEKLFYPIKLSAFYPFPENLRGNALLLIIKFTLTYGTLLLLIIIAHRKKNTYLFFGLFFFIFNLILFIIPVGVPVLAADRYAYLPFIGIFIIIAFLFDKYISPLLKSRFSYIIILIVVFPLIFLTHKQSKVWRNSLNLWDNVIQNTGKTPVPLLKRGITYSQLKNTEMALKDLNASIKLKNNYSKSYESRAYIYLIRENYDLALKDFFRAFELDPKSTYALQNLGLISLKTDKLSNALFYLNKCLAIETRNAYAHKTRAKVYIELMEFEKACNDLEKSLEIGLSEINTEEATELINMYCKPK